MITHEWLGTTMTTLSMCLKGSSSNNSLCLSGYCYSYGPKTSGPANLKTTLLPWGEYCSLVRYSSNGIHITLAILVKTSLLLCSHHCQQVSALPQGGWGWLVITVAILVNIIAVGTQVKNCLVKNSWRGKNIVYQFPNKISKKLLRIWLTRNLLMKHLKTNKNTSWAPQSTYICV